MGVGGAYSNTKYQLRALEALRQKLPDLNSQDEPSPQRRPPRRARRLDDREVRHLIESYRAGQTVYELADQFGISRNTASKILHRNDVPIRHRGLSADQITEALRLRSRGWSPPQIGHRLGVSAVTIRRRLREHAATQRISPRTSPHRG